MSVYLDIVLGIFVSQRGLPASQTEPSISSNNLPLLKNLDRTEHAHIKDRVLRNQVETSGAFQTGG